MCVGVHSMEENKKFDDDKMVKKGILGFFIGLAVIVPGISGSTIMIIFKLYNKILHAVANFIKEFKYSIMFLAPILVGILIGVIAGFFTVRTLIDLIPFAIVSLFAGLMIGAIPSLKDEVKEVKMTKRHYLLIALGISIPLLMAIISLLFAETYEAPAMRLTVDFKSIIIYIILGIIVAATQFIPGCSATAALMALGFFKPIMDSLKFSYISSNPMVLFVYLSLFVGFILGCALVGKLLNMIVEKYKNIVYFIFIGLSIGSIIALFVNTDMLCEYNEWINIGKFPFLDIFLGIGLFVSGILIAYQLVKYMRKNNINKQLKLKNQTIEETPENSMTSDINEELQ